ncbi:MULTISPECIES: hypothetical protein [Halorussus]|uniref:DUF7553 family protein n=1 Tax=Halorussus TaxID=1070314 RepID=UPI000E2150DE|nr:MULTISPECIES: hypothetical protein [Halorussus]NHN57550.1 hypothetical protein [Halorussus sp. JP-T4]
MADLRAIHEEIQRIRDDADADREVRLTIESIEESLSGMRSAENDPRPDRLREVRAELDRLADDASPAVADELAGVREQVREFEREEL